MHKARRSPIEPRVYPWVSMNIFMEIQIPTNRLIDCITNFVVECVRSVPFMKGGNAKKVDVLLCATVLILVWTGYTCN